MHIDEAVKMRKSIRAYTGRPVAKELIQEIIELAVRAPSWGNTQPWEIMVVGGKTVKAITEESCSLAENQEPTKPDFNMPKGFSGAYMDRYRAVGINLFKALDIGREDREKRAQHSLTNVRGFNAGYLIYIIIDESLSPDYALYDCGILSAYISLLAASRGLGTCLQAALAWYPDNVRKHLSLDSSKKIALGISIGYPDDEADVNKMTTMRAELAENVKWFDVE